MRTSAFAESKRKDGDGSRPGFEDRSAETAVMLCCCFEVLFENGKIRILCPFSDKIRTADAMLGESGTVFPHASRQTGLSFQANCQHALRVVSRDCEGARVRRKPALRSKCGCEQLRSSVATSCYECRANLPGSCSTLGTSPGQ